MARVCTCWRAITLGLGILFTVTVFKFCRHSNQKEDGINGISINFTDTQELAFNQFKEQLKPFLATDPHLRFDGILHTWLEKAKFDENKAVEMVTENVKWKQENNIYGIQDEDWSDMAELQYTTALEDFSGRPIGYLNWGSWPVRKLIKAGKKSRLDRFSTKVMDEIANRVYRKYENGEQMGLQYILMATLENFGILEAMCLQCCYSYLHVASLYQDKYPFGFKIITINTPPVFSLVAKVIRPMLHPHVRNNSHFLGGPEEYEPFLSELRIPIWKNQTYW